MNVVHSCGRHIGEVVKTDTKHAFFIEVNSYRRLRDWAYNDSERRLRELQQSELEDFTASGGQIGDSPALEFLIAVMNGQTSRGRRRSVARSEGMSVREAQLAQHGNEAVLLAQAWSRRRDEWPSVDDRLARVAAPNKMSMGFGWVHNGDYEMLPMPLTSSDGSPVSYCECVNRPLRIPSSDLSLGLANLKNWKVAGTSAEDVLIF